MNIKFADEIRRCCGVAKISLGSNIKELGVRCKSFDYIGKTVWVNSNFMEQYV